MTANEDNGPIRSLIVIGLRKRRPLPQSHRGIPTSPNAQRAARQSGARGQVPHPELPQKKKQKVKRQAKANTKAKSGDK